jgi:hypothetical protein
MELTERVRPFFVGYGLSIAAHIIVMLLLTFGVFERNELAAYVEVPVEIVMEKPPEAAHSDANAETPTSRIPPQVADIDKRAKAPLAPVNVNGIDSPTQPGRDGRDLSADHAGAALPSNPNGEAVAARRESNSSQVLVMAPIGPAPPQMTVRELGEDEMTAIQEQKVACGLNAKGSVPTMPIRRQGRVKTFATQAQVLQYTRNYQADLDRRINPGYIGLPGIVVQILGGPSTSVLVSLPRELTVNDGDLVEYERGHLDPLDSCQWIPNLVLRKL